MSLTATDLFCGAGGSSSGLVAAGVELVIAANHWRLAVETHATNHRAADHDCADISQVDPRRYPATDILWASPECTNHSQAKSHKHRADLFDPDGDPSAERSRATMWDVPRFAEVGVLRGKPYRAIIVENVVEARKWLPFQGWLAAMDALGYHHQAVYLNSMVCWPTPQSRDRMYVVFWRHGQRAPDLDIRPPAWCWSCEAEVAGVQSWKQPSKPWGKYRTQYLYRCPSCGGVAAPLAYPALSAIDPTVPITRIGDRAKPLAEATRRRVEVGLELYGRPVIAQAAGHTFERPGYSRVWSADRPLPVMTTTLAHALAVPSWMLSTTRTNDPSRRPIPTDEPSPTLTGQAEYALALPFLSTLRGGGDRESAYPVDEPMHTVTSGGNHHALTIPPGFLVKNYGGADQAGSMTLPLESPFGTLTAVDSTSYVGLPFTVDYHGTGRPHPVTDPLGTQTSKDRHALVEADVTVDDCGFRMLEPHEVKVGMGMAADYELLGTKRDKVRLAGNAVTPPSARELGLRVVASLDAA